MYDICMVENISILCPDREYAKQVAAVLAERLDMQWLDVFDMIMFDNNPRTFSEILSLRGQDGYRRHELSCLKYAATFKNTIIVCEIGCVEVPVNLETLRENTFILYLHIPARKIGEKLENTQFASPEEKAFFVKDKKVLDLRIALSKQNSNIVINCSQKTPIVAASHIVRQLKQYAESL